jgi:hypothetical protein
MSNAPIRLSLAVKSLQRLESGNYSKDYAVVVGDERYPCPSFLAEALSPRVASLPSQDITINEISIETDDLGHHIERLVSI